MALPHISYSRLHLLACPYASFLRYSGNVKGPSTPWIARGNAVHDALEHSFIEGGGFDLNHAITLYKEKFAKEVEDENVSINWAAYKKMEAEAIIMLENFNGKIESGEVSPQPLALEKEFKLPFLDTYVVGKIDKVDFTDGEYIVTDYKTGKAKPDKWFLRHNLQLTAYAWACLELYGQLPSQLIWHHLATNKLLPTERSLSDVDDLKAMIANAIAMDEAKIKHRIFHEDICAKCDYVGALCDDRDLEAEIEQSLEDGTRMPKSIYIKPQKWNLV